MGQLGPQPSTAMEQEHEAHIEEIIQRNPQTATDVPLDLEPDDEAFLCSLIGLKTTHELKSHILRIQKEAAEIFPYPCIRRFDFVKLKISKLPCYSNLLQLIRERPGSLLLDVGCCFGTDVRKAILDGFPAENIIASDLRSGFWEVGHKLFRSHSASFPVTFLAGNIFDNSFVGPTRIMYGKDEAHHVDHRNVASLAPLCGCLSFIHASNLFHLFTEEQQTVLASKLASLLSPELGSMIFGVHVGRLQKGLRLEVPLSAPGYLGNRMFCHNAESWKTLWEERIFKKGTVNFDAEIVEQAREDLVVLEKGVKFYQLRWCVTRISSGKTPVTN